MYVFKRLYKWYKRPNKSIVMEYVEAFVIILPIAFVIRTFLYGLYQVPTGSMEPTMLVGERFLADKFSIWFSSPQRGDIISFNAPTYQYSQNPFMRLIERYVWLPWTGPANWTKRVIAVPGDHVKGVVEDGKPVIYLNGEKLHEPYINPYPLLAFVQGNELKYKTYDPSYPLNKQPFYQFDSHSVLLAKRISQLSGCAMMLMPYTALAAGSDGSDIFDYTLKKGEYLCLGDNRLGSFDSRGWGLLKGSDIHGKIILRLWSLDSDDSWWFIDLFRRPLDFWKKIRWSRCLQWVK